MTDPSTTSAIEQRDSFSADGYVYLPGLFTGEEAAVLRAAALEHEQRENWIAREDRSGRAALSLWTDLRDDPLGALVRHPRVVSCVTNVLGEEVYHWHSKVVFKQPHSAGAWVWHQDYGYWFHDGAPEPRMVSCMLFLDDAREDNGCLELLVGSHKLGRLEHEKMDVALAGGQMGVRDEVVNAAARGMEIRKMTGSAGGMVVWHSNTFHRSAANRSDHARTAFIVAYNALSNAPEPGRGHGQPAPIRMLPDDAILRYRNPERRAAV